LNLGIAAYRTPGSRIPKEDRFGIAGSPELGQDKMDNRDNVINWLLEDKNPAIAYRTKIELLGEKADSSRVIDWLNNFLPADWQDTKGLWRTYYYTTIAECGLNKHDIKIDKKKIQNHYKEAPFEYGCGDFMLFRALVMLGFNNEIDEIKNVFNESRSNQLPDGGFLCLHRVKKMKYVPKSCIKSNHYALMFCAECKKRNIKIDFIDELISYFWKHNVFYKTNDLSTLVLNCREGWRTIDTFYPFETMRVGLQNLIESFCALGYGTDKKLNEAWKILHAKKNDEGKYILNGTLTKSYLPKEKVGQPSKWVTLYALLAEKNKTQNNIKQN
jgi:hypothetical protein